MQFSFRFAVKFFKLEGGRTSRKSDSANARLTQTFLLPRNAASRVAILALTFDLQANETAPAAG